MIGLGLLGAALAAPISDYSGLSRALERGATVRAVIHYGQCLLDGAPGPGVIGGMTFDVFEMFPKASIGNRVGFVSTSETRLILHPSYGHVLNYARLKVYEDGRAELTARYLDSRNHKVRMHEVFGCSLGEHGGVHLTSP